MKKLLYIFLVASLFTLAIPASAAVGTPKAISTVSQNISNYIATKGSTLTLLNGDVRFGMQPGALAEGSTITFTEVDPSYLQEVMLPSEYGKISKIFMYEVSSKPLKPLWLTFGYKSDLKFTKFLFAYDEKNQNWKTITSKTDLTKNVVSASLTAQKGILLIGDTQVMHYGKASWYKYKGCMCAASPDYPKGTQLLVVNKNKNQGIVVKVNDWGPERDIFPDRVIDLDLVAFTKLGTKGVGVFQNMYVTPYIPSDLTSAQVKTLESAGVVNFTQEELAKLEGGQEINKSLPDRQAGRNQEITSTPVSSQPTTPKPTTSLASDVATTYLWLK